jgi:hypothetical protein
LLATGDLEGDGAQVIVAGVDGILSILGNGADGLQLAIAQSINLGNLIRSRLRT